MSLLNSPASMLVVGLLFLGWALLTGFIIAFAMGAKNLKSDEERAIEDAEQAAYLKHWADRKAMRKDADALRRGSLEPQIRDLNGDN